MLARPLRSSVSPLIIGLTASFFEILRGCSEGCAMGNDIPQERTHPTKPDISTILEMLMVQDGGGDHYYLCGMQFCKGTPSIALSFTRSRCQFHFVSPSSQPWSHVLTARSKPAKLTCRYSKGRVRAFSPECCRRCCPQSVSKQVYNALGFMAHVIQ